MKGRFVVTPEAKADLRDILLDIAEDSPSTAERLRSEIYEGFQRLGQSPGIGHYHEELLDRRCFWNFYSYVVCYATLRCFLVRGSAQINCTALALSTARLLFPMRLDANHY